MDWVIAAGSGCLGFVVGALIGFYIDESDKLTFGVINGAVSIIAGAGVVAAFRLLTEHSGIVRENWFYAIGLAVGFVLALLFNWLAPPDQETQGG